MNISGQEIWLRSIKAVSYPSGTKNAEIQVRIESIFESVENPYSLMHTKGESEEEYNASKKTVTKTIRAPELPIQLQDLPWWLNGDQKIGK